jgi:hypothetical protein
MTAIANFDAVILAELQRVGGQTDIVWLARSLNLDAHGLAWELERCDAVVNINGKWAANTVVNAVLAYNGSGAGDLPVAEIRDDVAKIVQQHPGACTVHFTPRGGDGAGDFEVFDFDGRQFALVSVYADGRVEALPVVQAELAADEAQPAEATVEAQTLSEAAELLDEAAAAAAGAGALATSCAMSATAGKLRDAVSRAQEA